jgi:hypothetical protein
MASIRKIYKPEIAKNLQRGTLGELSCLAHVPLSRR